MIKFLVQHVGLTGDLKSRDFITFLLLILSFSLAESRQRYKLYVLQMLLAMAIASDDAIDTFRSSPELKEAFLSVSSYAFTQKTRRWLRYPGELWKHFHRRKNEHRSRPFIEAASVRDGLSGQVQGTANQLLAAIGYNQWVPKIPRQKGLRILCFDGGGTRACQLFHHCVALLRRWVV